MLRRIVLIAAASSLVAGLAFPPVAASASTGPVTTSHPKAGTLDGDTDVKVKDVNSSSFESDGPYAVGTYTLNMSVTDANGVTYSTPVDIWYPARKVRSATAVAASYDVSEWLPPSLLAVINASPQSQALAALASYTEGAYKYARTKTKKGVFVGTVPEPRSGRFPLVLFSHGYAGFRDQSTYLTTHLASWGFVVAAPDQQTRVLTTVLGATPLTTDPNSDVTELLDTVKLFTDGHGGLAQDITDPTRVVAFGHSAGGSTVERLASYLTAEQGTSSFLKGFIGMAGADFSGLPSETPPYNTVPSMPGVLVGGSNDQVVLPATLQSAYSELTGPRRYIELTGAGHLVFSDLCQIDPGQGGLTALATALGITLTGGLKTLATDGCFPPDTPVTTDWPIVDQIVVASVRQMLGFDTSDAGDANLVNDDPTLVSTDTVSALP
jgi:alpha-beta hydrolase superfamily lysophospholipase